MINIVLLSNLFGSFLFLILTIILLINWRGQLIGGILVFCSAVSALWFSGIAYNVSAGEIPLLALKIAELIRTTAWLLFLYIVLIRRPQNVSSVRFKYLVPITTFLLIFIILSQIVSNASFSIDNFLYSEKFNIIYIGYLLLSVLGLLLIEQLYRTTKLRARWTIKFLCLGLGGIFIYDFFLYSEALLFNHINADLWYVRGTINGLCVPLIAISVSRNPHWKLDIFVSRHVIYQSTATLAAGIYLMVMAITGYYIRNVGGTWGTSLQVIFFFSAIIVLFVLLFSEQLREKLKIFLALHFYKNKYDYREEWLGLTQLLSDEKINSNIYKTAIAATANIMKCTGGGLWLVGKENGFSLVETVKFYDKKTDEISIDLESQIIILENKRIIDIQKYINSSESFQSIVLPDNLVRVDGAWLLIPLISHNSLLGFIFLTNPLLNSSLNTEDEDLLRTVGFQIASYIELFQATNALSEARQFEAFNRLSAFVVHDIKNLVAQLSMITLNAEKYKDNPEFISDSFATIESSVSKMKRLLSNLSKDKHIGNYNQKSVNVEDLIKEVILARNIEMPYPELSKSDANLVINSDAAKLAMILEHLIQNAQEATADTGSIVLELERNDNHLIITITDNGSGMDEQFIKNRLFKPFDTTKGNAGMGIGVYESREVIKELGGRILVESVVSEGTIFTIKLPYHSIHDKHDSEI
jgi:putative PEP-CTERM system histidine kinase